MSVPETSMNKNDCLEFWQYDIGLAGQFLAMKPETEALPVQKTADNHFRLCILPFDAGHHPAAGFFVYNISHAGL